MICRNFPPHTLTRCGCGKTGAHGVGVGFGVGVAVGFGVGVGVGLGVGVAVGFGVGVGVGGGVLQSLKPNAVLMKISSAPSAKPRSH